ncbi:hypothetical protein B0T10DRAFT_127699 [Thelonectria olida]|uniref:Uncharacterized protein n=1 Tax=Thelonectria olida TaxID=1576542 RepID=A0A9P9AYS5_9HYPO|nr:hypothetical protein B0T10DRAFT_127699 [Thelonectria olida]
MRVAIRAGTSKKFYTSRGESSETFRPPSQSLRLGPKQPKANMAATGVTSSMGDSSSFQLRCTTKTGAESIGCSGLCPACEDGGLHQECGLKTTNSSLHDPRSTVPVPVSSSPVYWSHPCLRLLPALQSGYPPQTSTILRREAKSGAQPSRVWLLMRPSTTIQSVLEEIPSVRVFWHSVGSLLRKCMAGTVRPSITPKGSSRLDLPAMET